MVVGAYSFESNLVDVKGYNWHMSAKVDDALTSNDITGVATQIGAGTIVQVGDEADTIDVAQANSTTALGVMNETRPLGSSTDGRAATYTWAGVVRVMTDTSAVLVGSHLKPGATGLATLADGTLDADQNVMFGRSLEANGGASTIVMAFVNFSV